MTAPNTTDVHSFSGKGDNKRTGDNPWAIEPMPAGLIDSPLDFIFAEHHRQREAASILTLLADGEFDLKGVKSLLAFLETDFALHIGDEELALFPMLREHCLPEDNVERILARLVDEHRCKRRFRQATWRKRQTPVADVRGAYPSASGARKRRLVADRTRSAERK